MAIILGTVGFRSSNPASASPEATSATQELGPGTLTTLTGQVIDVDTLMGRVILVNAWATWCGPCIQEMPGFQRVQDELKDEGFLVLGMAGHDMGPGYVSAFLRDLGITYPVTLGPQRPLDGLAGQVRGIPTSFLLDRDGQLIRRVEGLFPENALRTAVRKLLTEDPPKTPRIDHVG
jgi:thiol-disulfide isomerase/thioredoxin